MVACANRARAVYRIWEQFRATRAQFVRERRSNTWAVAGLLSAVSLVGCVNGEVDPSRGTPDESPSTARTGGAGNAPSRQPGALGGASGGTKSSAAGAGGASDNEAGSGGSDPGVAGAGGTTAGEGGGAAGSAPTLPCEQTFVEAGYDGCQSTIGEIETKYFPLPEGRRASRLAVYLHSDTAAEWYDIDSVITDVLDWAEERDVVVAALLSPAYYARDAPHERSFGALNQYSDTMKIGDTLQVLVETLGVSPGELLVWSTSGGSWFLASSFFPVLGGKFQGLFALSCGGSSYRAGYEWDPDRERSKAQALQIWFNYGTKDFLAEDTASSRDHYKSRGMVVSETTYPGAQHCAHAIVKPTLEFWTENWR